MAIAVVYRPPALGADQYKASWANGSPMPGPTGLVFHAGVGEGDEFFTVSVWEDRAAYDAFASRFREALGAEGFEGGKPTILPVHHTIDHGVAT
jgi:heme-degrading monooxygenase HmoA